jgi:predicted DNA-binding transcriptional regulator YafY
MNRIDRVTAILIQLQSKRIVKAQEVAERFSVSLRTVYRDIRTLEEAGVPILGEAGVGYSLMEGYRLPPVMFTREEASAFLVAEKLVEQYAGPLSSRAFSEAMFKIKAVLRSPDRAFLEDLDETVKVMRRTLNPPSLKDDHSLHTILTAVHAKRVVSIDYRASYGDETFGRVIEPIGVYLQNGTWYLIAYCRLREDYRNFRVDRIDRIELHDEIFVDAHLNLDEYLCELPRTPPLERVRLKVDRTLAKFLVTEKYYHGFLSETEQDDHIEMTFLSASLEGFARWFMMFGVSVRSILEPEELREKVRTLAKEILEKV